MNGRTIDPDEVARKLAAILQSEIRLAENEQGSPGRPSQGAGEPVEVPSVDLSTLLAEMAALKSEIRQHTQAFRQAREQFAKALEVNAAELHRAHARRSRLKEELQRREREGSRGLALSLIDIADRLEGGLRAAGKLVRSGDSGPIADRPEGGPRAAEEPAGSRDSSSKGSRTEHPLERGAAALADGLRLTLDRVGRHLAGLGVERVRCVGGSFAPDLMEAIETTCRSDRADGEVVEEITAGYRDPSGTLRPAQVVVNRLPAAAAPGGTPLPAGPTPGTLPLHTSATPSPSPFPSPSATPTSTVLAQADDPADSGRRGPALVPVEPVGGTARASVPPVHADSEKPAEPAETGPGQVEPGQRRPARLVPDALKQTADLAAGTFKLPADLVSAIFGRARKPLAAGWKRLAARLGKWLQERSL